jgi:hypothetical protein
MKTVYPSTEIAHLWAHATQDSARNPGGSVSFAGGALRSYSTIIAVRISATLFVVELRRLSVTTSEHQSWVRRAIPRGAAVIECEGLHAMDLSRERWEFRLATWLVQDASEKITHAAAKKRESTVRAGLVLTAEKRLIDALLVAALAPRQRGMKALVRSAIALQDALRSDWARQARAYQQVTKGRPSTSPEHIAEWRAGTRAVLAHTAHPVLRLVGDVVETSWGARVPVSAARDLWSSIAMVRGDEQRSVSLSSLLRGRGYRVGNYPFNELRADGSLVIGCHDIPASEVDTIAGLL